MNKRFLRNRDGNLSIVTAIVGMLLLTAVGATMDGGRMITTKQKLQSITDAAALMGAMPEGASAAKRKALAESSVQSHAARVTTLNLNDPKVEVRNLEGQVYVELTADVPMLFGAALGDKTRRVSVSSTAQESVGSSGANAASISIVLDLSSSMDKHFDRGSKLSTVNAAVSDVFNMINSSFGGEAAAATRVSTGVYPFNWGMVEREKVALQPGTKKVHEALAYLSTSEGRLPTTAMEDAVEDQIEDAKTHPGRDRFIVYISDGRTEEDKSDRQGTYLRKKQLFESKATNACLKAAKALVRLDRQLDPTLASGRGNNGLINVGAAGLSVTIGGGAKPNNFNILAAKRVAQREAYIQECKPGQTLRIVEACEKAREDDISVIAVNLSGKDGEATNTVDMCANGIELKAGKKGKKNRKKTPVPKPKTKTLPSGVKLRVSVDGQSFSGDPENLNQLRDMLSEMLATGQMTRTVRLVN